MTWRGFLARLGLARLSDVREAETRADYQASELFAVHARNQALRAENVNLKRAGVDRLAEEIGDYRAARLPSTADDPPPFGHTWGRPDPRSGTGPIKMEGSA